MATFETRNSGFIQAKIRRKGYPTQSKSFRTKTEAEAWALQVEAAMGRGSFVSSAMAENTIFKDVADRFAKDFAPYHYRSGAWEYMLKRLVERLGEYSLVAITPSVLCWYRDSRLKDKNSSYTKSKNPPPVSPGCVKKELNLLSKVLDVAVKEFGISLPAGNPVRGIRLPKDSKPRDRRLTKDEWESLVIELKRSRNPWLWSAVILAVETAVRQGELLQLSRDMIDKKRRLALLLDTDKIKNGEARAVPLSSNAMVVLEGLPSSIDGRSIPLEKMTLYKAFKNACKRASIEDFTWHDLRHEAISRLAERGDFETLEIAAISGHKTLQMLKRYTHLQAERLAWKLG